jgi:soluble lytic murein transglycosylase-like protein
MSPRKIGSQAKPARSIRARFVLCTTVLALAIVPVSIAHAEWYYTESGAQKIAKEFVANEYANTYTSNLTASCRPQGRSHTDPRYKYHRWVCLVEDSSDGTSGVVRIVGSRSRGGYYGKVLGGF